MVTYSVYKTEGGVAGTDGNAPSIDGVTVSSTTTYYSKKWSGTHSDGYGLHVSHVGTATGTFTLWISDVEVPNEATDADWVQDTGFTPTNPAGADSKFRDDASNSKGQWKRLKYVNASGTGVIKARVSVPRTA